MIKQLKIIFTIALIANSSFAMVFRENHLENNAYSARSSALGNAGASLTDSIDNAFYSPASLGQNKTNVVLKSNASMADVNQFAILSVIPLGVDERVGFTFSRTSVGDIAIGADTGTAIKIVDTGSYSEQAFFLSYAKKFEGFSGALTYKTQQNKLDVAADIYSGGSSAGSDMDFSLWTEYEEYQLAAGYKNLFSMLNQQGTIQWANGSREAYDFGPYFGVSRVFEKTLLVSDLKFSKLYGAYLNLGAEYLAAENVALRGGFNKFHGISFGLGVNYNEVIFDYAYVPDYGTEVDTKHYLSAGYQFDAKFKEEKKVINKQILVSGLKRVESARSALEFAINQATLKGNPALINEELTHILKTISRDPAAKIRITSSSEGGNAYNARLVRARQDEVAKQLVKLSESLASTDQGVRAFTHEEIKSRMNLMSNNVAELTADNIEDLNNDIRGDGRGRGVFLKSQLENAGSAVIGQDTYDVYEANARPYYIRDGKAYSWDGHNEPRLIGSFDYGSGTVQAL